MVSGAVNVSVNPTPVRAKVVAALLSTLKMICAVWPTTTDVGENDLVRLGNVGTKMTTSSAVLVAPLKLVTVAPAAVVVVLALLL